MTRVGIVVNVGNTRSRVALVRGRRLVCVLDLRTAEVTNDAIVHRLRRLLRGEPVFGALVGSVVPSTNAAWVASLSQVLWHPPLFVSPHLRLGVRLRYPRPGTLGADRIANAAAVVGERYPLPAIVADLGTAATFDVIGEDGSFVGGAIAPGPAVMLEYLAERTALLPRVLWGGKSHGWVGRSTRGAMRVGTQVGYRGLVDAITQHLMRGLRTRRVTLLATGGYARQVFAGIRWPYRVVPDLTLRGLAWILEWNTAEGRG